MRRRVLLFVTACVTAVAVVAWLFARPNRVAPEGAAPPVQLGPRRSPAARAALAAPTLPAPQQSGNAAGLPAPPASLRDTEIDGDLLTDADGHFQPGVETRLLFDYFFSATGEEPDEAIAARIRAVIDERLPPAAAADAKQLLERYREYRRQARDLHQSEGADADLEERFARVSELRQHVFGEHDAAALFADDEKQVHFAIEARRRLSDPNLSSEQKQALLADLETQMPDEMRAARDAAMGPARLTQDEEALRRAGGTDEEIRALRVSRYGEAAADRLEELDRRRAERKSMEQR